jgi:hypothetical protein
VINLAVESYVIQEAVEGGGEVVIIGVVVPNSSSAYVFPAIMIRNNDEKDRTNGIGFK